MGRCDGWGRDCCEQKNFQVFKHFEKDLFVKIKGFIYNWIIFLFGKILPPSWFLGMSGGLQITWTGPTSDHPVHPTHLVIQNTPYKRIHPMINWLSNNWFQQAFLNFKGHMIYETEKAEVMFKMTKAFVHHNLFEVSQCSTHVCICICISSLQCFITMLTRVCILIKADAAIFHLSRLTRAWAPRSHLIDYFESRQTFWRRKLKLFCLRVNLVNCFALSSCNKIDLKRIWCICKDLYTSRPTV